MQSQDNDEDDLFAEIDSFGKNSTQDALDNWLDSPPIANVDDPIAWWTSMASSGDPFACMSLDFLSAPGRFYCKFIIHLVDVDAMMSRYSCIDRH